MLVQQISMRPFRPGFTAGPYAMSHVTQTELNGLRIGVRFEGGLEAYGECVSPPAAEPADVTLAFDDLNASLRALPGESLAAFEALIARYSSDDGVGRGIAFGLETAWLDARARADGVPMHALLGARRAHAVPDYLSIAESTVGAALRRLRSAGPDRRIIQLKVGVYGDARDSEMVAAILAAITPEQTLLVDANGGWDYATAASMAARFEAPNLVWEEPCSNFEENCALIAGTGSLVMLDQCVANPDRASSAIEAGLAHSITIKPAFLGGLERAKRILTEAERAGMRVRIDGPWCGAVATAAIAHLAVTANPQLLLSGCDLSEPLEREVCVGSIEVPAPGLLAPPEGCGLGLVPRHRW